MAKMKVKRKGNKKFIASKEQAKLKTKTSDEWPWSSLVVSNSVPYEVPSPEFEA